MTDDVWGDLSGRFVDAHYGSLRGVVRSHVVGEHLRQHLGDPPGPVVDVGGGAGTQSIPLARRGYDVTILDSSPGMLARAAAALTDEADEVRRRVTLVEADGAEAVARLGSGRFAAVLCHGVLLYLDDPDALVTELAGLAGIGGIVSIVTKNRATLAVGPGRAGDWRAALAAFDADGEVNRLGLETRADSVDGIAAALRAHGVEPIAWYGVRLFTDDERGDAPPDPADLAEILAVEVEASRREPYRSFSRLFHIVGRRTG